MPLQISNACLEPHGPVFFFRAGVCELLGGCLECWGVVHCPTALAGKVPLAGPPGALPWPPFGFIFCPNPVFSLRGSNRSLLDKCLVAPTGPCPAHGREFCKIKGWGPPTALEMAMPRARGTFPIETPHHVNKIN